VTSLLTSFDPQHSEPIPDERLKMLNFSVLLAPADLKAVAHSLNDMKRAYIKV